MAAKRRKPQRRKQPTPPPEPRAWFRFRRTLTIPGVGRFQAGQVAALTESQHRANKLSLVPLEADTPVRLQVRAGQRLHQDGREHGPGDLVQCAFADAEPIVKSGVASIVEAASRHAPGSWSFTMTRMHGGLVARPEREHLAELASHLGL